MRNCGEIASKRPSGPAQRKMSRALDSAKMIRRMAAQFPEREDIGGIGKIAQQMQEDLEDCLKVLEANANAAVDSPFECMNSCRREPLFREARDCIVRARGIARFLVHSFSSQIIERNRSFSYSQDECLDDMEYTLEAMLEILTAQAKRME